MITIRGGMHVLICDDCYEEVERETLEDIILHMKICSWSTENCNGTWYNYCADCKKEV